jgi:L-ascorbate metabolism protein UlaG (beta-lactamase superfamily)
LLVAGLTAFAAAGAAAVALARSTDWLRAFGGTAAGARLDRVRSSPQWRDGRFVNTVETVTVRPSRIFETLRLQVAGDEIRYPQRPIPVVARFAGDFDTPPASELRVTWLGHATALVEIDGVRILTDPVWSERVSPSEWIGPRRFFAPPLALEDLPPIDAVVVSHDHYDHLDMRTIEALAARGTRFFVPLGVAAHLETWGVPPESVEELDWEESRRVGEILVTLTPARHFSGRGVRDGNATLWGSWVLAGPRHRVFYSGDSGWFDGFAGIGAERGPFDATLMSAASYGATWPDVHMDPEQLVRAHRDLRGDALIPVHWATFNLAFHDWERADRPSGEGGRRGRRASAGAAPGRDGGAGEPAAAERLVAAALNAFAKARAEA